ncbi:MAG: lipid-A-disaccharide synthase [Pseudomonadota bacterium]|nr:lipid-A-disaccharide synthase [Pseudomonadota bacterium]
MSETKKPLLIAIVAGEVSGDILGAGLIRQLRLHYPDAMFVGLGGEHMEAQGLNSLGDMELLSVMGLIEPLKRLPQLLSLRKKLHHHFIGAKPAVFIGIDSPDFNLPLAKKMKRAGVLSCQYVCPSVWAWRQGRVNTIRRSVDHVLTLLPFEQQFLTQHQIDATFVGHPLADHLSISVASNRDHHGEHDELLASLHPLQRQDKLVCVMPGSRLAEVDHLLPVFIPAMRLLSESMPSIKFVIPAASAKLYAHIEASLAEAELGDLATNISLLSGESQYCMAISDTVLLASGTASLEAALLAKPMVVAYKMSRFSYAIISRLLTTEYVALPNLLTRKPYVPEFIQQAATPEALASALLTLLTDEDIYQETISAFAELTEQLAQGADLKAAAAVADLIHNALD